MHVVSHNAKGRPNSPIIHAGCPGGGFLGSGNIPIFLACWLCGVDLASLHVLWTFDVLCTVLRHWDSRCCVCLELSSLNGSVLPH